MKTGARALGVAESYARDRHRSTLAGAVVRASRVTDGFAYETCTVGGTDATDAVVSLYDSLDREDVRYLLVAGIAVAWYNPVDLHAVAARVDRPAVAVTFEDSDGLDAPLEREFDGPALRERRRVYRAQPPRSPVDLDHGRAYVRAVGLPDDRARDVVRAFTPEGGRPEPLRVARLAARAADDLRGREGGGSGR
jgi:endonuclease V-like protein UPF0215 family